MKFEAHYITTVFIALLVGFFFDAKTGILIGLAHFIPSIDWIMKRLDVVYHHHRKLAHNVFMIPLSYTAFYWLTQDLVLPIFCALSTSLHLFMDYADKKHKGVALLFPFSKKMYKLDLVSERADDIITNIAFLGSLIMAVMLVLK